MSCNCYGLDLVSLLLFDLKYCNCIPCCMHLLSLKFELLLPNYLLPMIYFSVETLLISIYLISIHPLSRPTKKVRTKYNY